ncbi:MAG: hypothetical protein ABGY95_02220 [Rubritalea sp.]
MRGIEAGNGGAVFFREYVVDAGADAGHTDDDDSRGWWSEAGILIEDIG